MTMNSSFHQLSLPIKAGMMWKCTRGWGGSSSFYPKHSLTSFELWCWRRLLRVPWTARRSNQSILKEINPEYSLEAEYWGWSWSSKTLATWCEEPTHWKRPQCWEKIEGKRRGQLSIRWLESITNSMDMNLNKLQETVEDGGAWRAAIHGVKKSQTGLRNKKTTKSFKKFNSPFDFSPSSCLASSDSGAEKMWYHKTRPGWN